MMNIFTKMKLTGLFWCIPLAILGGVSEAFSAEVWTKPIGNSLEIIIEGDIEEGDFQKFIDQVRRGSGSVISVLTYSNGGDFYEAMKIGRAMRALELNSIVPMKDSQGKALSGMLDILINVPTPNPELLVRAGYVNSIGHNLDIAGSAEKASSIFQRLLTASPSDPRGNYMYGTFLAGVGKPKEALPYLEKALAVGVTDAAYAIGMTYLTLGDKGQALKNLEC